MTLYDRCSTALAARLRDLRPTADWIPTYGGYVSALEDNILKGIGPELYRDEFERGAGKELQWTMNGEQRCPPKMHAAFSSSALVVNAFARWKTAPALLSLRGQTGFTSIGFEEKCSTGLGGTPPHPDVLLKADGTCFAVESKCIEFLNRHRPQFSPSYDGLRGPAAQTVYFRLIPNLRQNPMAFQCLDVAQLIKHALGLANTFPNLKLMLLYLFWEPSNCREFPEFGVHRAEIDQFAAAVSDSNPTFVSMSYAELWEEWKQRDQPAWLAAHLSALGDRYNLAI